jgi:tetratricopeptide (TPR) repeat protein
LRLGRTQREMGSLRPAMQTYRKVLLLQPRLPEALFGLGQLAAAVGEANLATMKADELAQIQPHKPEPHLILAQVALHAGNREQAALQWRAALGKEPANQEAREQLVTLLLAERSFAVAAREAEAGIKLLPDNVTLPLLLARSLSGVGKSSEALAVLQRAVARDRTGTAILLQMGELQVQRGEFVPAMMSYEEVLKRSPNDMVAMNNIALLIADHGYELDRAEVLASALYTKNPKNPGVMDTMGWVLFKQGKQEKQEQALALLQLAVAGAPNNPVHHYHYGAALLKAGDGAGGRREMAAALKISGNFDGAARARVLLGKKK